jgi:hypothetical protein
MLCDAICFRTVSHWPLEANPAGMPVISSKPSAVIELMSGDQRGLWGYYCIGSGYLRVLQYFP